MEDIKKQAGVGELVKDGGRIALGDGSITEVTKGIKENKLHARNWCPRKKFEFMKCRVFFVAGKIHTIMSLSLIN